MNWCSLDVRTEQTCQPESLSRSNSANLARDNSNRADVPLDRRDHRIHSPAQYLLRHTERESLGGVERRVRRHGQGIRIHDGVDDNRTVFVCQGLRMWMNLYVRSTTSIISCFISSSLNRDTRGQGITPNGLVTVTSA